MVLLIGNYAPDRQQSMLRFGQMMLEGLRAAGQPAELLQPRPFFGRWRAAGEFAGKWLAYLDKYLLFPRQLRRRLARGDVSLVHICDHSNAVYVRAARPTAVLVTCHDLLAVRGALGEETDCPASAAGNFLQRWILRGLAAADAIACDSRATLEDADRLLPAGKRPALRVITLGLSHPYGPTPAMEPSIAGLDLARPFVLHVGSNLRRKNRDGALRIFARTAPHWHGQLVFAGEPLPAELRSLADEMGIRQRVVEAVHPENSLLEALYQRATALLYPSRFEGFGWPIAEAQACGCPVICSATPPMPEVAGEAGLIHAVEDEQGFADEILRLSDPAERARWSARSLENARQFSAERMIAEYQEMYRALEAA